MFKNIISLIFIGFVSLSASAEPTNFEASKIELRQFVFHDQTSVGTIYCGCKWEWVGRSGGRIDLESCGYEVVAQQHRAERLEWEHIMPASNFGRARQCWQNGGRGNCNATDPVFNRMEADMHNLAPSIGEVNADRSNFNYGMLSGSSRQYGSCPFKVDFSHRIAEPRDAVKGHVARVYFYMADRYNLPLSRQQQQLFMAWDKSFPVTENEKLLESRAAKRMGHHNRFVTRESKWSIGHKNSNEASEITSSPVRQSPTLKSGAIMDDHSTTMSVRGNRNSHIYHLAQGCPSYDQISKNNIVEFADEASASAAGYRKAGNCK